MYKVNSTLTCNGIFVATETSYTSTVHLQPGTRLFSIFHSYENMSIRLHSLVRRICRRMLDLVPIHRKYMTFIRH